tara:strand:+ start:402 stop:953 length:552 start_codon:yes stop_codon:yes gene_type:complete
MKKRLLNEEVTRRFMKLANIDTLSESFIEETEELEEGGMAYARDDEDAMEEPAGEEPDLEGAPEEPEMEVPSSEGLDVEALVRDLVDAIEENVPEAEGMISVEGEGEAAPEEPMPEPEPEMDAEPEAGLEEPAPEEEEELMQEDDIDEDLAAANVTLDEDEDFVNEVTRRVARRLLRAAASNK